MGFCARGGAYWSRVGATGWISGLVLLSLSAVVANAVILSGFFIWSV